MLFVEGGRTVVTVVSAGDCFGVFYAGGACTARWRPCASTSKFDGITVEQRLQGIATPVLLELATSVWTGGPQKMAGLVDEVVIGPRGRNRTAEKP